MEQTSDCKFKVYLNSKFSGLTDIYTQHVYNVGYSSRIHTILLQYPTPHVPTTDRKMAYPVSSFALKA